MKALLLVDIQNDFLPGGALAVKDGDAVIDVANTLMDKFDHVIASKDWHPKDHCSFSIWPEHCVQGSNGAEFPEKLNSKSIHKIVYKGQNLEVDSYSAFFDNEHVQTTDLNKHLKEMNIDTLYILGLATDFCVKFTVLDALSQGIKTYLVKDGCRAVNLNAGDEQKSIDEMKAAGAKIITSDSI